MSDPVHILCTCRSPELLRMATLVFKTIRVGFPTADITVTGNDLPEFASACIKVEGVFINEQATVHHEWIRKLIETESEPFWIVDTDIIFYESVEHWKFEGPLAGYRVPEWRDEYTGCITRSRLHPSLLWIDPIKVRAEIDGFQPDIPTPVFSATDLLSPKVLPLNGRKFFHDTCSLLYHAIGGTPFTDVQKDAYFHFHFGTVPDLVLPKFTHGQKMSETREEILSHPAKGRGKWRRMEECYADREFNPDGKDVIVPISVWEGQTGSQLNIEICRGDPDAMQFNLLYRNLCHGIDDLIDTLEDGRPKMSKDQIISLFFLACVVYNHKFYIAHRDLLYATALHTTNTFKTSVAWERSSIPHRRIMADCFRTCGNKMYEMVALICGGETSMADISRRLNERDWLDQHDEHGNPI